MHQINKNKGGGEYAQRRHLLLTRAASRGVHRACVTSCSLKLIYSLLESDKLAVNELAEAWLPRGRARLLGGSVLDALACLQPHVRLGAPCCKEQDGVFWEGVWRRRPGGGVLEKCCRQGSCKPDLPRHRAPCPQGLLTSPPFSQDLGVSCPTWSAACSHKTSPPAPYPLPLGRLHGGSCFLCGRGAEQGC